MKAASIDGYSIGERYTAVATYGGSTSSSYVTGYTVTADYSGAFKVCIPANNIASEGSFKINAVGECTQFNLFIACNPNAGEQSYIVSDPGYTTCGCVADFKWSSTESVDDTASLQVVKAGLGGSPLEGASFTLTGSGGTTVTGTSDRNGQIIWRDLPADETYTLTGTAAPEGYQLVEPIEQQSLSGDSAQGV